MQSATSPTIWDLLTRQATRLAQAEPALEPVVADSVLGRSSFADALAHRLLQLLASAVPEGIDLPSTLGSVLAGHPDIAEAAAADLDKLATTNPACPDAITGFLSFRGFQALQLHRINHELWLEGREQLAVLLQNWGARAFAMDIHPQARIGRAVFLDHGIGLVIGATAVVEDGANIWHGVTLGGTLTQSGDRHPKVRRNVTIGASATVLGNIEIGEGAIIAAGSVVLRAVEPYTVVAGSPAKVVGSATSRLDAIAPKPD